MDNSCLKDQFSLHHCRSLDEEHIGDSVNSKILANTIDMNNLFDIFNLPILSGEYFYITLYIYIDIINNLLNLDNFYKKLKKCNKVLWKYDTV